MVILIIPLLLIVAALSVSDCPALACLSFMIAAGLSWGFYYVSVYEPKKEKEEAYKNRFKPSKNYE